MTSVLYHVRRFIISVVLLIIGVLVVTFLFEQLIAVPADLQILAIQAIEVAIIVASSSIVVFLIRRFRSNLSLYFNPQVAAIFSFFMILATIIVAFFAVLYTFQVSVNTLLIGGGIVTLIIGLVISTVFGNIFAGALMLTTSPFRVGDTVLVNNIPGEIEEITSMFTRIRNSLGGETIIPNSALIQGAVTLTKIPSSGSVPPKLPYSTGDRIYTTYIGGEGVVTEITSFYTKILLDSSKEVTIPNNSIITGAIQIARMRDNLDARLSFSLRIDWNAENAVEAIKDVTSSDPATFKSPPVIHYSSLDGKTVELQVSCEVDPNKKSEAKSIILRTAYLSRSQS